MVHCEVCGKELEESGYMNANLCHAGVNGQGINIITDDDCFSIHLWRERVKTFDPNKHAIINGRWYTIGQEEGDKNGFGRGFGGYKFIIQFDDGRVVTSTNLWHGGKISSKFIEQLPNNAKSNMFNKSIWKSSSLPYQLSVSDYPCYNK